MRVLLLQDKLYLPSLGGGHKANRFLMQALAKGGHCCAVIGAMLTTRAGPATEDDFFAEMAAREIPLQVVQSHVYRYRYKGVEVDAPNLPDRAEAARHAIRRIGDFSPDCIIVSDDRSDEMLRWAEEAAPGRAIALWQTVIHLPFGPDGLPPDPARLQRMLQARRILVISRYLQSYLREHGGIESEVIYPPVYGEGPFSMLADFERGYVTLINPCIAKGLPIFLELAKRFPQVEFAAVPTWGEEPEVLDGLRSRANIRILRPVDDIEEILAQTRILLAPSLWAETFGYVSPEAMLRGIPVLASDIGGLPEAKLGVDYLLPVTRAQKVDGRFISGPQNVDPWASALCTLLNDRSAYETCSRQSRLAALQFHKQTSVERIDAILREVAGQS